MYWSQTERSKWSLDCVSTRPGPPLYVFVPLTHGNMHFDRGAWRVGVGRVPRPCCTLPFNDTLFLKLLYLTRRRSRAGSFHYFRTHSSQRPQMIQGLCGHPHPKPRVSMNNLKHVLNAVVQYHRCPRSTIIPNRRQASASRGSEELRHTHPVLGTRHQPPRWR